MSNYDKSNFSTITSGWVPIQGNGYFFFKISDNQWILVVVPNVYSIESANKLQFVGAKTGAKNINKYYIETLATEFKVPINTVNDSVILAYLTTTSASDSNGGDIPSGDYLVDGSSVIVGGQRYNAGSSVYYGGFEYKVLTGKDGAILVHPDASSWDDTDTPITGVNEMVHEFDYRNPSININSPYTKLDVKVLNGDGGMSKDKLTKSSRGKVSRVLGAPESSTLRYWECYKFHSGVVASDKVETVTTGDWSSVSKLKS